MVGGAACSECSERAGPRRASRGAGLVIISSGGPGGVSNGGRIGCPMRAANALGPSLAIPDAGAEIRAAMLECARRNAAIAADFRLTFC